MQRLSDGQWERIREHFPEENVPPERPGRKPVPARQVLDAVRWILNTGAQWHMLPQCYPNYKTVHRRFQQWCEREILRGILADLANELRDRGEIDESECFIDATFASAKGGGAEIGNTRRGKGVKIMAIVDRHGLPLSVSTHAANHHEVTLVQLSFDFYMIEAKPQNLNRRQGVRQRCAGQIAEGARHGDDRATSLEPNTQDAGRSPAAALRSSMDGGTLLRMATVEAATGRSLGVLRQQFPRIRGACQHHDVPKTNLR